MPPQIKQAKLETLEAIIKEVEGMPTEESKSTSVYGGGKPKMISRSALLTTLQAEKELIEGELKE